MMRKRRRDGKQGEVTGDKLLIFTKTVTESESEVIQIDNISYYNLVLV